MDAGRESRMKDHGRGARALIVLAACGVLIFGWTGAAAASGGGGGAGTTHHSQIIHNGTEVFFDFVPCHPELGGYRIRTTFNGQFHDTDNRNGEWITGTQAGTFRATPIEFRIGRNPDGSPRV